MITSNYLEGCEFGGLVQLLEKKGFVWLKKTPIDGITTARSGKQDEGLGEFKLEVQPNCW